MNYEYEIEDTGQCNIYIPQYQNGQISWFLSIIVSMFYSQGSKKILLNSMNNWNMRDKLFVLLATFLNQYNNEYNIDTIRNILQLLFDNYSEDFMIDPSIGNGGFDPFIYIGALYNLLNIKCTMFEFNKSNKDKSLVYSLFNKEYDKHVRRYIGTFDDTGDRHLLIKMKENSKFFGDFDNMRHILKPRIDNDISKAPSLWKRFKRTLKQNLQPDKYNNDKIKKYNARYIDKRYTEDEINKIKNYTEDKPIFDDAPPILIVRVLGKTYDGNKEYTYNNHLVDANFNNDNNYLSNKIDNPEIIKNITSLKENIEYMGAYYKLDSIILNKYHHDRGNPTTVGITCENKKYVFNCINKMELGTQKTKSYQLFENNWDINNNEEINYNIDTDVILYNFGNFDKGDRILIYVKVDDTYPFDQTLYVVATGGLNLRKNLKPKRSTKSAKKPPEGKVLNPKTGRYILIKNKPPSEKIPTKKSAKKPPEGKVLNPKTGRYILIKNKPSSEKIPTKKSAKKPPEGKVLNHKK
jgi:hypothetical protein